MAFIGSVAADRVFSNLTVNQTATASNLSNSAIRMVITMASGTLNLTAESGTLVAINAVNDAEIVLPATVVNGTWYDVTVSVTGDPQITFRAAGDPSPTLMNCSILIMAGTQVPPVPQASFINESDSITLSAFAPGLSGQFRIQGVSGRWCVTGLMLV